MMTCWISFIDISLYIRSMLRRTEKGCVHRFIRISDAPFSEGTRFPENFIVILSGTEIELWLNKVMPDKLEVK